MHRASSPFLYRRSIYIPDRKLFKPLFTGQGTRTRRHASIAVLRQHGLNAVSPKNIRPRGGAAFLIKAGGIRKASQPFWYPRGAAFSAVIGK